MHHLLRTAILIVAAMIASALILATLFGLVWNVNLYGKRVVDFLPTQEVRAVIFHPTEKSLNEFPFIEDAPKDLEAVVVFKDFETAFFARDTEGSTDTLGPYSIKASSPETRSLIQQQGKSLSTDATFKSLHVQQGLDAKWTYLSTDSSDQSTSLLSRILKAVLIARSDGVALSYPNNGITVEHLNKHPSILDAPVSIPNMSDTFFIASFSNLQQSFLTLLQNLSAEDALVTEALLGTSLSYFGEGISLHYDILPLFQKTSSIQMSASGGVMNILLSGSINETIELHSILDRLHTTYELSLPSSIVTKRILDKRFSSIDIRHNKNMVVSSQYTKDGWLIRNTGLKRSTKGLCSATKADRFLISTTSDVIDRAILNQNTTRENSSAKITLDLSQLELLLPNLTSSHKEIERAFGTGALLYKSSQKGAIRKATLEASKKPLQLLDILNE